MINEGKWGEVDIIGVYKVRVPVDKLCLAKIEKGLRATNEITNKTYELQITYVYVNITNGRFDVDIQFIKAIPEGIRRDLLLCLDIEFATLIPVGTGGNWIYVAEENNKK